MLPSPLNNPILRDDLPRYPPLDQVVRVTATTVAGPAGVSQTAGSSVLAGIYYVSFTQQRRTDSGLPRDREPCLVHDVNGTGLTTGFYVGRLAGSFNSLPVYEVGKGSGLTASGLFTAREVDTVPSTTTTLNFPNTSLTDNGDGTVTVKSASATETGLVNTTTQGFAGNKSFQATGGVASKTTTIAGNYVQIQGDGSTNDTQLELFHDPGSPLPLARWIQTASATTNKSAWKLRVTDSALGTGKLTAQLIWEAGSTSDAKKFILGDSADSDSTIQATYSIYNAASSVLANGQTGTGGGSDTFVGGICTALGASSLFDYSADAGNATTVETDLYSSSLSAGRLGVDGDKLDVKYSGVFVSSGTATRQLKVYFGGTVVFDSGALTLSLSSAWVIEVLIIRVSSSIVRCAVSMTTQGAALAAYTAYTEVTGLTLSNAQTIKITGTAAGVGAATNDIVAKLGYVRWMKAA